MVRHARVQFSANGMAARTTAGQTTYARLLRFEPLEDRRMLSIVADEFGPAFAQVSRVQGSEVAVLTVDPAGHFAVFYRPNTELGYINPETGDLLAGNYFAGTSVVVVIDAVASGNVSQLVGQHYSNGQLIADDGGNTLYHRDGSIMRSGGVWTYDAGLPLRDSSGNYFWSLSGRAMKSGTTYKHPNGTTFSDSTGSIYYAGGTTFDNNSTAQLFYPASAPLRDAAGVYYYESGAQLDNSNTIFYPGGVAMVDANGTVHNSNGDLTFTPFYRHSTFTNSEDSTTVTTVGSDTVIAAKQTVSGSAAAYVTRIDLSYNTGLPPDPVNFAVTAPDTGTLRFSWTSGGGSTASYRVAVASGVSAPGDPTTGADTTDNFCVVSGLMPGQKVSIRVWAKNGSSLLSPGVVATGTAGDYRQARQTGNLIESALADTFAQVYDSASKNVVYTVDKQGNSFLFYHVNNDVGYVNLENGDRLQGNTFEIPGTDLADSSINDFRVTGNLATIVSGAYYSSGNVFRNGDTYYYDSPGVVLRSAAGTWYYADGHVFKDAAGYHWDNGNPMQTAGGSYYSNGTTLRAGGSLNYEAGTLFASSAAAFYPNGASLETATGGVAYENGSQLLDESSNTIHYLAGSTMIDSAGVPYLASGASASVPFEFEQAMTNSNDYFYLGTDHLAEDAVVVRGTLANYFMGGSIDYAAFNPLFPGDYNQNGQVDAADYVLWRKKPGSYGGGSPAGYDTWRANFGATLPTGAGTSLGLAPPETESLATTQSLVSIAIAEPVLPVDVTNDLSVTGRRVESEPSLSVTDHSESDLQLLIVVVDWRPPASTPNDLVPISPIDNAPSAASSTLDAVDDAFALLALGP